MTDAHKHERSPCPSTPKHPQLQLQAPSLSFGNTVLYMQRPPALEASTRPNLAKALGDMVADGEVLSITDPSVSQAVSVMVKFTD